jgi:hypothetical protein
VLIFISKKPNDFTKLKSYQRVLNINWQFHSSGLNKETFSLAFKNKTLDEII